jgi:hypothetical protein
MQNEKKATFRGECLNKNCAPGLLETFKQAAGNQQQYSLHLLYF